jgi:hypothetical protein
MPEVDVLGLSMPPNDADAKTVKDYLKALLTELWREQEGFSGKRPFGNSGWEYDMYPPLIKAGLVEGELDENGYVEDVNQAKAQKLIAEAIQRL